MTSKMLISAALLLVSSAAAAEQEAALAAPTTTEEVDAAAEFSGPVWLALGGVLVLAGVNSRKRRRSRYSALAAGLDAEA
ncbi:MAG: hypothetical protein AAF515_23085 [Pseudomonadota bacterium]